MTLPCTTDCIRLVPNYLKRVWRGEPNYEDKIVRPQAFSDVRAGLQTEHRAVYSDLDLVLQRNKPQTLAAFVQTYGLGSDDPAVFALDVLSRLKLQEACPLILRSMQAVQSLPAESFMRPRQELQNTMASLQCK